MKLLRLLALLAYAGSLYGAPTNAVQYVSNDSNTWFTAQSGTGVLYNVVYNAPVVATNYVPYVATNCVLV